MSPSFGNLFEDVDRVSEGNIVGFEALEFSGMFVFEVGVAFIFVVSEVVFPQVDSFLLFEVVFEKLGGKQRVDEDLALGGASGRGGNSL